MYASLLADSWINACRHDAVGFSRCIKNITQELAHIEKRTRYDAVMHTLDFMGDELRQKKISIGQYLKAKSDLIHGHIEHGRVQQSMACNLSNEIFEEAGKHTISPATAVTLLEKLKPCLSRDSAAMATEYIKLHRDHWLKCDLAN